MVAIVKGVPFTLARGVTIPPAPPTYFLPSAAGLTMPARCDGFELLFDLSVALSTNRFAFFIEFQRPRWTDAAGLVHVVNEWLQDCGSSTFSGGAKTNPKTGLPTSDFLRSSVGARGPGGRVEAYPIAVRVRVDAAVSVSIPSITLKVF